MVCGGGNSFVHAPRCVRSQVAELNHSTDVNANRGKMSNPVTLHLYFVASGVQDLCPKFSSTGVGLNREKGASDP